MFDSDSKGRAFESRQARYTVTRLSAEGRVMLFMREVQANTREGSMGRSRRGACARDGAADAPEDVLHHAGLRKRKAAGMARSPAAGFDQAYLTGRRRCAFALRRCCSYIYMEAAISCHPRMRPTNRDARG